jgi:hypothetical protein
MGYALLHMVEHFLNFFHDGYVVNVAKEHLCNVHYEQQRIVIVDRFLCSCFQTQERAQREKMFYYVFIPLLIWLLSSMF